MIRVGENRACIYIFKPDGKRGLYVVFVDLEDGKRHFFALEDPNSFDYLVELVRKKDTANKLSLGTFKRVQLPKPDPMNCD